MCRIRNVCSVALVIFASLPTLGPAQVSVPIEWKDGRPTVMLSVDDGPPLRLIVDTGAMVSLLRGDVASSLGLEPADRVLVGDPSGGAPREVPRFSLARVSVGTASFSNVEAIGLEDGPILERMGEVAGVLSPNVFGGYVVTLDFASNRMNLEPGALNEGDGSVPYPNTGRPFPAAEVFVGGEWLMADIDTGNGQGLALPSRLFGALRLAEGPDTTEATMLTGSFPIVRGVLADPVSFSGFDVERAPVHFHDAYPHANIGAPLLRGRVLSLDPSNRRLRMR